MMALKTGSEDKKKVAIAGLLGAVVLFLVVRTVWQSIGGSTPAPSAPVAQSSVVQAPAAAPAATATSAPAMSGSGRHAAAKIGASMAKLDPTLHPEWMAQAESLEYTGKGRNIFSMSSVPEVIEAVKGPIRPLPPPPPPGPPPPPPIDLKFFGFEATKVGARKAFLLHGDDVFIAAEGDVVDHRYRVVKIAPFNLQVEDIPYHDTQTLPLVQN